MDIEKIIEYVLRTPENTNPNILRGMLQALVASEQPDLSFVTATADKILVGYDGASSAGTKVEGAYTPLDTSDATATAEDIMSGKTAYVNGVKIEGTYTPPAAEE